MTIRSCVLYSAVRKAEDEYDDEDGTTLGEENENDLNLSDTLRYLPSKSILPRRVAPVLSA